MVIAKLGQDNEPRIRTKTGLTDPHLPSFGKLIQQGGGFRRLSILLQPCRHQNSPPGRSIQKRESATIDSLSLATWYLQPEYPFSLLRRPAVAPPATPGTRSRGQPPFPGRLEGSRLTRETLERSELARSNPRSSRGQDLKTPLLKPPRLTRSQRRRLLDHGVPYDCPRRYSVEPEGLNLLDAPEPLPLSDGRIELTPEAAALLIDIDRRAVIRYAEWHVQQGGRLPVCDGCGVQFVTHDPPLPPADSDLKLLEIICTDEGAYSIKCYCGKCAEAPRVPLDPSERPEPSNDHHKSLRQRITERTRVDPSFR